MIRIAHISDLHFGREIPEVVEGLVNELNALHPELIAVSGDLTQRALVSEFQSAHRFFERLSRPLLIVPGNHDVPDYPVMRFAAPWSRWKRWLSDDLEPIVEGSRFCAVGINSARRWGPYLDWSRGRINLAQIRRAEQVFSQNAKDLHIVVAHHPFLLTPAGAGRHAIARAEIALPRWFQAKVDLILGGHVHMAYSGVVDGIVVAQTGTTLSSRLKGEPNSYNRIRADNGVIEIDNMVWLDSGFVCQETAKYSKKEGAWHSV
ncbi:MAG TPA: metallophosphoesterase family protein [Burkholderiales bacterium]|nr:metallophosphoesterase family protein [Burkholderiales bacterium]